MDSQKKKIKIGFTCGVFDLFHAGHVLMLKECKEHCDFLIVALNKAEHISTKINPNKKPPIFSYEERKLIIENCKLVDNVVGYNSEFELEQIIKISKANIRFLGQDYKGKLITGRELIKEIYYTNRDHGLSTSHYRNRIIELG